MAKQLVLFNPDSNFDFVGRRRVYYALTAVGILLSLIAIATLGFNKGIDFKGGTKLILAFESSAPIEREQLRETVHKVLVEATGKEDVGQVEAQDFSSGGAGDGKKHFSVVTELTSVVTPEKRKALADEIAKTFAKAEVEWATEGEDRVFVALPEAAKVTDTYSKLRELFAAKGFADVVTSSDLEAQLDVNLYRSLQMMQTEGKDAAAVAAEEQKLRDAKAAELADKSDARYSVVVQEFRGKIEAGIQKQYGKQFLRVESATAVSPSVAGDMLSQGLVAILYAIVGIVLYIILRFDVRYAPGALIALSHDVILVIGAFSVAQVKFSMPVVAAVLTVAGYSITDTIVVFDRIREMMEKHEGAPIETIVNAAVNQTMSRTVLTAATVFMTSIAIFLFGGGLIRDFAFALCIGVVVGSFSSIFVANPIFMALHKHFEARRAELERSKAASGSTGGEAPAGA